MNAPNGRVAVLWDITATKSREGVPQPGRRHGNAPGTPRKGSRVVLVLDLQTQSTAGDKPVFQTTLVEELGEFIVHPKFPVRGPSNADLKIRNNNRKLSHKHSEEPERMNRSVLLLWSVALDARWERRQPHKARKPVVDGRNDRLDRFRARSIVRQ